jgi:light-regulated signal transduction histidine kinase (bacteriophytochrome)
VSLTDEEELFPPGTRVDRTNYHREPIHVPGAIQSHGALLDDDLAVLCLRNA